MTEAVGGAAFEAVVADGYRLELRGDFDLDGVGVFEAAVDELLANDPSTVVIDLAGVTFLASLGIGCLVRLQERHPSVVLQAPTPQQLRLLEITGLTDAFTIEDLTDDLRIEK